ncbi:hypothetical protein H4R35_005095 [Dimargaris xerosporica]|nr:hypothetical protein H4R35_005095 [Dimargaris xerosporica]
MAEALKLKGNQAFKQGNYEEAIELYAQCIDRDPTNPVYSNNRAMALMKVCAYHDAAQDCTTSLVLDPKNVKALWRRGVCHKFLKQFGKAEQDLAEALKLEPGNKAVQEELYAVQHYREANGGQRDKMCIPVEVLASEHDLHTIISRDYSAPPSTSSVQAPIPSPREPAAPLASTTTGSSQQLNTVAAGDRLEIVEPRTTIDLQRSWRSYRNSGAALYQYFRAIPPTRYGTLFQSTFDSDYLMDIVGILNNYYFTHESLETTYTVLDHLCKVARFNMVLLFLTQKEKADIKSIFDRAQAKLPNHDSSWAAKWTTLGRTYQCARFPSQLAQWRGSEDLVDMLAV